jgi:aryl-alcohol dehydrogenase-like predicted oxidoreductase
MGIQGLARATSPDGLPSGRTNDGVQIDESAVRASALSSFARAMPAFPAKVCLGRSQLEVSPLAVSGGYGVNAAALRDAFERGVNYFYHGSLRRNGMREAVREIVRSGQRDRLVLLLQSYSRWGSLLEHTFTRGLKQLGTEYADVLLLGMFNRAPSPRLLERAEKLRAKGLVRHLAISSHNRPQFVEYANDPRFSILHIRYNAAHPGAERDVFAHLPAAGRPGVVAFTATCWAKLLNPKLMPKGELPMRARDCYRFVLTNSNFNVCLTGPRNAGEMKEALAALEDGPCSAEELERFRRIGQHVHG